MRRYIFLLLLLAVISPLAVSAAPCPTGSIDLNLNYPKFGPFDLNDNQNLVQVVAYLYYFIVGISGLAAFVMLVWGGVQWLMSGAIPSQAGEARDKIRNAILGLLLVLASFLIIQIINPGLTVLNQPVLDCPPPPPPGPPPPPPPPPPPGPPPPPPPGSGTLIFRSGFESASGPFATVLSDITGIDNSVGAPNNWNDILFWVEYVAGQNQDRYAKIINDPTRPNNRILQFALETVDVHPDGGASSRVQTTYDHNRTEIFQRVRMYIHPDIRLATGDSNLQFMFQGMWVRNTKPNQFAIPFRIFYNPATEATSWLIEADDNGPTQFWEAPNNTVPVPIGKWFTAETYYKMGNASNGRIVFTIQPDGESKRVVADVHDETYHPDVGPQGMQFWNPHKLYNANGKTADAVRNGGGVLQIFWDDWEVWTSFPP